MKVILNERKLLSIFQKLINECLEKLKYYDENPDNADDWVDTDSISDVSSVNWVKINNIDIKNEGGNSFFLFFYIHVDIEIDSIRYFETFSITEHLCHYIKDRTFHKLNDVRVRMIVDNINNINKRNW